jgi:hypothetical protein
MPNNIFTCKLIDIIIPYVHSKIFEDEQQRLFEIEKSIKNNEEKLSSPISNKEEVKTSKNKKTSDLSYWDMKSHKSTPLERKELQNFETIFIVLEY